MDASLAQLKVHQAIDDGRLIRPKICSQCGRETRIVGHHPDYDKPLEVIWLCTSCHFKLHGFLNKDSTYDSIPEMNRALIDTVHQHQLDEGLSNRKFSKKLGISRQLWDFILSNKRAPRYKLWLALIKHYPELEQPIKNIIRTKALKREGRKNGEPITKV